MATAKTLIPDKEVKIEAKSVSRKDEVKVTNLLSEIRTTDLPKESPIQVDTIEEKETNSKNKDEGLLKEGDNEIAEEKDKAEKEGNGDKKVEEVKKVDNGDKKAEEVKKIDNSDKKTDDTKKAEKEGKKSEDEKKVENGDKKEDRNNKSQAKSPKKEKVSPLASFFKDWDKFTIKQKMDIERLIMDKAVQMGASPRVKHGVRTFEERDRNRFRWNAIRRRREYRRRRDELRLEGSRSLRDRRPPSRIRGAGDSRSRNLRDDRRWSRYSPRREALPWRSPWTSSAAPVESLLKQMERFVQMVDKFPNPNHMVHGESKRLALLPSPPNGYNMAIRANGLHNSAIEEKSRDYTESTFAPSQRWPVQPFPVNGEESSRRFFAKESSSKNLPKQRPTPYNSQPSYSSSVLRNDSWPNRERAFSSQSATMAPYQESRYKRRRN